MADRPATTSTKKKPGRKRRVAGWLLLVIGVLIAGVWGASRWWRFGYAIEVLTINASRGVLAIDVLRGGAGSFIVPELRWFAFPHGVDDQLGTPSDDIAGLVPNRKVNLLVVTYVEWRVVPSLYSNAGPRIGTLHCVEVALWPFALASLLGGGWLVWSGRRARRRAMAGVCLKCGYDLAGLSAGAPCPECGKGAAVQTK